MSIVCALEEADEAFDPPVPVETLSIEAPSYPCAQSLPLLTTATQVASRQKASTAASTPEGVSFDRTQMIHLSQPADLQRNLLLLES